MKNMTTGLADHEMKIRGFKQNILVEKCYPYNTFKEKVLRIAEGNGVTSTELWQHLFKPDLRKGSVTTGDIEKRLDVVVQKGIVDPDDFFDVLPFGY